MHFSFIKKKVYYHQNFSHITNAETASLQQKSNGQGGVEYDPKCRRLHGKNLKTFHLKVNKLRAKNSVTSS